MWCECRGHASCVFDLDLDLWLAEFDGGTPIFGVHWGSITTTLPHYGRWSLVNDDVILD